MQNWDIVSTARPKRSNSFEPFAAIASLGTSVLPKVLFDEVNQFSDFACMVASTFTLSAIPKMDWTACNDSQDFAVKCTQIYQPEFAHSDPIHLVRQRLLDSSVQNKMIVNCVVASDISNREHRSCIYEQFNLRERWSIAQRVAPDRALTISLLKRANQSRLTYTEINLLLHIAPMLLALVRRDHELTPHRAAQPQLMRNKLLARSPDLAARELEVCIYLLRGMTLDAIASELHLKKSTVETYRDRAYRKLDIHFRSQLFALAQ